MREMYCSNLLRRVTAPSSSSLFASKPISLLPFYAARFSHLTAPTSLSTGIYFSGFIGNCRFHLGLFSVWLLRIFFFFGNQMRPFCFEFNLTFWVISRLGFFIIYFNFKKLHSIDKIVNFIWVYSLFGY